MNRDDNNAANPGRRRFLLWLSVFAGSLALFLAGIPVIGYVLAPLLGRQRSYWVAVGPVDQFSVGDTVHVAFRKPVRSLLGRSDRQDGGLAAQGRR